MIARELLEVSKVSMETPILILGSSRTLRMVSALFNLVQLTLGTICVGMATWDMKLNFTELIFHSGVGIFKKISDNRTGFLSSILKFTTWLPADEYARTTMDQLTGRILLIAITSFFVIATYIFFVWYIASLLSGTMTRSTLINEVIYHSTGFAAHFLASSILFMQIEDVGSDYYMNRGTMLTLAAMVMANSILYLMGFGLTLLLCRRIK
ncbi:uncharacterized protein LOC124405414 [Diprion similis]|uniref:uncharacterized protein LOC124405414 n=1 Tax=Diprion similis TaxID=362088 RepID=UPI001EF90A76|nr:uncharacterized protein LOC124405414 [Diprion similis]